MTMEYRWLTYISLKTGFNFGDCYCSAARKVMARRVRKREKRRVEREIEREMVGDGGSGESAVYIPTPEGRGLSVHPE